MVVRKARTFLALALCDLLAPVTAVHAGEAAKTTSTGEKLICRTEKSTGSLTRTTRSCRTSREWTDLRRQQREQVEKMQAGSGKYQDCAPGRMC